MITLRALETVDLDVLYELENEQELWPSSNSHTPYSRFVLEQFILSTQNDIYLDRQLRLVAMERGTILGLLDLCNFNPQHGRAEVSIALVKEKRHQGLGGQAIKALVDYARKSLRLHQLYAIVASENLAALKTFEFAGFQRSGTMKDWISTGKDKWTDAELLQLNL